MSLDCRQASEHFYLALVIYREARGEPPEARVAVGHTVLTRVTRPCWWGNSIETVITKKWQFSSLTDPGDPQVAHAWPTSKDPAWQDAWTVAGLLIDGMTKNPAPGATHYHDISIMPPHWAASARRVARIGRLIFYEVTA